MGECTSVEELLLDWLEGDLDEAEGERVRRHLADCPACEARSRDWSEIRAAYREHPAEDVDDRVAERVLAASRAAVRPPRVLRWPTALAAAAALLLLVGLISVLGPDDAASFRGLIESGDALTEAGEDGQALDRFERALAVADDEPERALALQRIGEALFELGQFEEAAGALGRSVAIEGDGPERADALFRLAQAQMRAGQQDEARRTYEQFAIENPHEGARAEEWRRISGDMPLTPDNMEALRALGYIGGD